METKLAALGNKKELLPLKSLGFALFDCKNLHEAEDLLEDLSGRGFGFVVVSEDIVEGSQKSFLKFVKKFPLAVLVLPQYKIKRNFAKNTVKKIIKEAVGF
ncbi:MAG: hypothetical protein PHW62_02045 [Candidatus Ratteibacteria bacterium]|nr:hypothetical protein [Candidatus Ratteibacteria bacterium]